MRRLPQFIFLAVFLILILLAPGDRVHAPESLPYSKMGGQETTVIFVGDLMVGRFVETLSRESGYDYPFRAITPFLETADIVFANFEGVIPVEPWQTPLYSFRLAFPEEAARSLKDAGVTIVSLANNHATDFGEDGYLHTREILRLFAIESFGHPRSLGEDSLARVATNNSPIYFLGLNETFGARDTSRIQALFTSIPEDTNPFIVVSVHWGEEYSLISNERQKDLAHFLIDSGADLIIGHHPHVIQEIEEYRGRLIFYSLGNFIFDQYFSEETKTGLTVRLTLSEREERYELVPVYGARSNPAVLEGQEKEEILFSLAERSSSTLSSAIMSGVISLPK